MTPEQTIQLELARDALDAVRAWPEHVPSWWRFSRCFTALDQALQPQVLDELRELQAPSAQAQWFRHSALHEMTGDAVHLVRQAALAPALPDPERWMALAWMVWSHAISWAPDRDAFRQLVLDTRLCELLDRLGRERRPARMASGRQRQDVKRVALFAQQLSTGFHAGTALTFNLRALLEGAGVETRVFATQELTLAQMRGYFASGHGSTMAPVDAATWQLRMPGEVQVTLGDERFSITRRWTRIEQEIDSYEPDVVLFVGFYSPLVWALRERYPVVGMSLHSLPPIAPVDAWLSADPHPGTGLAWPHLPHPMAVHFPFRFWPESAGTVSRGEFGLAPDSVLLVSVGGRLDLRVLESWVHDVVALLQENARVEWLVVGLDSTQAALLQEIHDRIHVLPQRNDVPALIGISNIYVNPPRVGGGATVAMAMQLGVPVVSMAGSDGGDKVGPLALRSADGYRRRLREWVADGAARREAGAALRRRFHEELDISTPAAARRLADACREARGLFLRRQPAGASRAMSLDEQI